MTTTSSSTAATGPGANGQPVDYLGALGTLLPTSFDPNAVINALINAQQTPITNLQTRISTLQASEAAQMSAPCCRHAWLRRVHFVIP